MIPIIYESTEIDFSSNGLGRLRDCISCKVTEERNGVYELEMEYPVSGANYSLIKPGRIIGCTHEDSDDIQPFDIVGMEKPIDGTVVVKGVHISYRQSGMVVRGKNITTLGAAFTKLSQAVPENPFTYTTDYDTSSGATITAFDNTPRSVRQYLGGVDGSILDIVGGEYEFDRFTVKLWSSRGKRKDFAIRYGVNLIGYNEEVDYSETFNACIPYWTDNQGTFVVGDKQTSGQPSYSGREICAALDVSDKFDAKPTKANVNAAGKSYMSANETYAAQNNIEINFVRLQDLEGYEQYANLLNCKLCDSIRVIFPLHGIDRWFKIVKTVYDVLNDRYEEMELGSLQTTLADALGVNDSNKDGVTIADRIIETGTNSGWYYEKYASGKVEAWGAESTGTLTLSASGNLYRANSVSISIPSGIFTATPTYAQAFAQYGSNAAFVSALASPSSSTALSCQIWKATNTTASVGLKIHVVYIP